MKYILFYYLCRIYIFILIKKIINSNQNQYNMDRSASKAVENVGVIAIKTEKSDTVAAEFKGQYNKISQDNQHQYSNGSSKKILNYTMKLQVKKQTPQNQKHPDSATSEGGQSLMQVNLVNNQAIDKSDSEKFRRISDKSQDHQRFFKNLIELPNHSMQTATNKYVLPQQQQYGNNGSASAQTSQNGNANGGVRMDASCWQNNSNQKTQQAINAYQEGLNTNSPLNKYLDIYKGSLGQQQYGFKGPENNQQTGNNVYGPYMNSIPNTNNISSNGTLTNPPQPNSGSKIYNSQGITTMGETQQKQNQGRPSILKNNNNNNNQNMCHNGAPQPAQTAVASDNQNYSQTQQQYFNTRSRLSQSSQKPNTNNGATAIQPPNQPQNHSRMHIQAAGADTLQGVSSIGQIGTQSSQAGQNFSKAKSNQSSLPKEIYDTLQKQNMNSSQKVQISNTNPATSKKGHQVFEELRVKYQQNPQNYGQNLNNKQGSSSFSGGINPNGNLSHTPQGPSTAVKNSFQQNAPIATSVGSVGSMNSAQQQQMLKYQRRIGDGSTELNNSNVQINSAIPSSSRMQDRKINGYLWPKPSEQNSIQNSVPNDGNASQNFIGAYTNNQSQQVPQGLMNQLANVQNTMSNLSQLPPKTSHMQNSSLSHGQNHLYSPSPRHQFYSNQLKSHQNQNSAGYSRSQSRVIPNNNGGPPSIHQKMHQFNQYKNVINNGNPGLTNGSSTVQSTNVGFMPPNSIQQQQMGVQPRVIGNMAHTAYRPSSLVQSQGKCGVSTAGATVQSNQNTHLLVQNRQRKEAQDLEDDPPPRISQNHYRHIHEQRDFTLENLSMAGETEMLDYDDYKIFLEFDWQLDPELQDLVSKDGIDADTRLKTDHEEEKSLNNTATNLNDQVEPLSPKIDFSVKYDDPFFRCRYENDTRKQRNLRRAKHDSQAIYDHFMASIEQEQQGGITLSMVLNNEECLKEEFKNLNQFIQHVEQQRTQLVNNQQNQLQSNLFSSMHPNSANGVAAMQNNNNSNHNVTLTFYKQLEHILQSQVKKLDYVKRLKQKAFVHESFRIQLQREIIEYQRGITQLKLRIQRSGYNPPVAFLRGNSIAQKAGGVFNLKNGVFDAEDIINQANANLDASSKNGLKQGSGLKLTGEAGIEQNAAKSRTNAGAKSHNAGKGKDPKMPDKIEINDKTLKLFRHFIDTSNVDKRDKDPPTFNKKKDLTDKDKEILMESGIPAQEIKLAKILMDKPAPHCSAQAWSIYDQKSNTLLFGKGEREKRECASLTKIMTAYVVLLLCDKWNIDDKTLIKVSEEAAGIIGTSAELLSGDTLSIRQLLYGLMLPSGNDAAHCFAEWFGSKLKKEAEEQHDKNQKDIEDQMKEEEQKAKLEMELAEKLRLEGADEKKSTRDHDNDYLQTQDKETNAQSSSSEGAGKEAELHKQMRSDASHKKFNHFNLFKREPLQIRKSPYVAKTTNYKNSPEIMFFLEEMNKQAELLNLKGTFYDSPHGLGNYNNKSTALDIARLSTFAMKLPKFREIVSTKFFTIKKNANGNKKTYKWYNTHMMLGQRGINGIKTGITPVAGPCLCTSISLDGIDLIVVIISTKSMDIRWPETWKLANWAMQRLRTIEKFQNQKHASDKNDEIVHKRLLNRIRHL